MTSAQGYFLAHSVLNVDGAFWHSTKGLSGVERSVAILQASRRAHAATTSPAAGRFCCGPLPKENEPTGAAPIPGTLPQTTCGWLERTMALYMAARLLQVPPSLQVAIRANEPL